MSLVLSRLKLMLTIAGQSLGSLPQRAIPLSKRVSTLPSPLIWLSLGVVVGLLGIRQVGGLQSLELGCFDWMTRLQPLSPPDDRFVVVGITEADIQDQKTWPITDQTIAAVLAKLQTNQPRVIGLDLYRDIPQPPGQGVLQRELQAENVIVITKLPDQNSAGVPPPPTVNPDQVGFSDLLLDSDNVVRRSLVRAEDHVSLSTQLAYHYLRAAGITPEPLTPDGQRIRWGKAILQPLVPNAGGYQRIDAGSYQLLLRYRAEYGVGHVLSLKDVLQGDVDPSRIRDKIVLIGTLAPSAKDLFATPYSPTNQEVHAIPGVFIHAHLTRQLISAALGESSLFWFWPEWVEISWIVAWAWGGGLLTYWLLQRPFWLGVTMVSNLVLLGGISFGLFLVGGWIPIAAPLMGYFLVSGSAITYSAYQARREQQRLNDRIEEQDQAIAQLEVLLRSRVMDRERSTTIQPLDQRLPPPPVTDRPVQPLLGARYHLSKVLGSGGFGLTYLAQDTQRPGQPTCVVKRLLPARNDPKFLKTARRLFQAEADILEILGKHAQIPQLLAYFEEQEEFYLVQEFIEGQSLQDELPVDHRLPETQVIHLLRELLEITEFIHRYRVIHRDIKPNNIIRRESDRALVLIDFGAVKHISGEALLAEDSLTVSIGTKGYAPPEQMAGKPGFQSDLYAIGMIAIQALTGIMPYRFDSHPVTGNILWHSFAIVSPELTAILDKMVAYHFADRYPSAIEVLQDLRRGFP